MPLSLLVVGLLGIQAEVTRFGVHHEVLYWGIRVTHGRAEVVHWHWNIPAYYSPGSP